MADHLAPETDPGKISPKVLASFIVGMVLTGLAAALSAATPELFAGLGPYAVPVSLAALAAAQYVSGYLKGDPARTGLPLEPRG